MLLKSVNDKYVFYVFVFGFVFFDIGNFLLINIEYVFGRLYVYIFKKSVWKY